MLYNVRMINKNLYIELIRPTKREPELGFQINCKDPCWSFFFWLDLAKAQGSKHKRKLIEYVNCEHFGPQLKLGVFYFQFTRYDKP